MKEEIRKHITENQLASFMNNTKWRELIYEISSIEGYEPFVNIKLIFEDKNRNEFSEVWWDEVEKDGFELIELMQINPVKTEKVGRLVPPKKTDYTEQVKEGLDKHQIPYVFENDIFKIHGYK